MLTKGYIKLKSRAEQIVKSVKTSTAFSFKKEAYLPYAYSCDNYIDTLLSNRVARKALQSFSNKYCRDQILSIKSSGQLVTKTSYPHFYSLLQYCYESLKVEDTPEVYTTTQLKGINALSVGTDDSPLILFSRKALIGLSDGELKFMIGHELGHILQTNLMCHTIKGLLDNLNNKSEILGPIVSDLVDVPLNQWYRCAEYTADRAGLICCKQIEYVESLFMKISNIFNPVTAIEAYRELEQCHPLYKNRIKKLREFSM